MPPRPKVYSKDELVAELQRLNALYPRQLTKDFIRRLCKKGETAITVHYYHQAFGGWKGALDAAGIEADPIPRSSQADEPPREGTKVQYTQNSGYIDVCSYTINTLEEALDAAQVDQKKWEVLKHEINVWQVARREEEGGKTNCWQVHVWLKPRVPDVAEEALKSLIARMPLSPRIRTGKIKKGSGIAGEIGIYDPHLGKRAWADETGDRDYDLNIATQDMLDACETNLNHMEPHKPEKIFYILGNDLLHVENFAGITPRGGNVLDVDTRFPKVLEETIACTLRCLYMCLEVAPTDVIWIPGNHDIHASLGVAHVIKHHFRNNKHFTIDYRPLSRKAILWGNLLVGWTHEIAKAKQVNWSNELAHGWPDLWGKSKFREWHCGHKHKKEDTKISPINTQGGVLIRQLTALSPIDFWHYENLFTDAVPGGESFLWDRECGVFDNHIAWTVVKREGVEGVRSGK